MADLAKTISETLKTNREKLSEGSLKTYISVLKSCYNKLGGNNGIKFFSENVEKVIEYIENNLKSDQTRKTLLSALFILTNIEDYRTAIYKYVSAVNEKYKQQKTNENRKDLISLDEIKSKYKMFLTNLKKNPTIENYILYFIVALTSCCIMPPRRSKDITELKIKNYSTTTDNCIDKGVFIFNIFKTAKFKSNEEKQFPVPKELLSQINKFKKISNNDYLIYNPNTGKKFDSSSYGKMLNKIYGHNVSVDYIRSTYLSDLYKGLPKLQELEKVASEMGHNVSSALNYYVKKD